MTGALGAGIPVVSASAGLEIGGQLGIEGAARAAVQVAWTPTTGLDLTAEAEIYAEPVFKFDITGDWSENYGDQQRDGIADRDGADIPVTQGAGRYTIDFNTSTKAYAVRWSEPAHNYPSLHVRGTANGWGTTPMTLTAK